MLLLPPHGRIYLAAVKAGSVCPRRLVEMQLEEVEAFLFEERKTQGPKAYLQVWPVRPNLGKCLNILILIVLPVVGDLLPVSGKVEPQPSESGSSPTLSACELDWLEAKT
eukprot:3202632-Rhodomonas_salina.1